MNAPRLDPAKLLPLPQVAIRARARPRPRPSPEPLLSEAVRAQAAALGVVDDEVAVLWPVPLGKGRQ